MTTPKTNKQAEATAPDYSEIVGEGRSEQYEATAPDGKVYVVTRNLDTGKHVVTPKATSAEDAE